MTHWNSLPVDPEGMEVSEGAKKCGTLFPRVQDIVNFDLCELLQLYGFFSTIYSYTSDSMFKSFSQRLRYGS